jgi:hypothetical protein
MRSVYRSKDNSSWPWPDSGSRPNHVHHILKKSFLAQSPTGSVAYRQSAHFLFEVAALDTLITLLAMATSAQITANQKNPQLSTGPRTEGRAVSSQNGVTSSLSSTFRVLMHENQGEFDALKQRIAEEHNPEGEHETFLVEQMVQSRWRLVRISRLENVAFDYMLMGEDPSQSEDPDAKIIAAMSKNGRDPLALLERYRIAAERAYYNAHKELTANRRAAAKEQRAVTKEIIHQAMWGPVLEDDAPVGNGFASQNTPSPLRL